MIFKRVFNKVKQGLAKTGKAIGGLFRAFRKIDPEFLEELEEAMISADMGIQTVTEILDQIQEQYKAGEIETTDQVLDFLKEDLKRRLTATATTLNEAEQAPTVILVAGVNGVGKTTSIAKIAWNLTRDGKKVLLAAADTFRAAAVEQLTVWSERIGCDIVTAQMGEDPGAVVYNAAEAALSREVDVLIIDTAGRLQNKKNLMAQLEKMDRVLKKKIPTAPHEVILVLDATTGQNAISQAQNFNLSIPVTGLFLAKLDGTAKGGIVVAIQEQLDIPVKFIGVGEQIEDVQPFIAEDFVEALFAQEVEA